MAARSIKNTLSIPHITEGLVAVLRQYGVSQSDAQLTVDVLVEGTLRGYENHGIERIFQIIEGFKQKTIDPNSKSEHKRNLPGFDIIDARHGLGQPIAIQAVRMAIAKAKIQGIAAAGIINAGHLGILAYYTELAAKEDCIGIAMTTSSPAMALPGSAIKAFGTNPICYSIPMLDSRQPLTADFSTTKVSRGKIVEHCETSTPIPLGWAVDASGQPTTDPQAALAGGLCAMDNGFKGCLLSLLVSVLAGGMLGGVTNDKVAGTRYMDSFPNKGDFFLIIDLNTLTDLPVFKADLSAFCDYLMKQSTTFRIPGARAHQHKQKQQNRLPVSLALYELMMSFQHA